ncbi:MAG: hypothetical protein GY696_19500 [Gammaproteobacteria bacterium]|nr:hypothetical protein [Gammaproteobacteria bacterium]
MKKQSRAATMWWNKDSREGNLKDFVLRRCAGAVSSEIVDEISEEFDRFSRPLEFLNTDAKQKAFFQSLPTFVRPLKFHYGPPRYETAFDKDGKPIQKAVFDSWHYVPIDKTLKVFLSQPAVYEYHTEHFSKPRSSSDVIEEFADGKLNQEEHPLLSDSSKLTAALDFYYDDITANPLGL